MTNPDFRTLLTQLAEILEQGGQPQAPDVRDASGGSDEELEQYLTSNDLWGGSGSVADSAFVACEPGQQQFQETMVRLGRLQMEAGKTNVRTEMWVTHFERELRKLPG